MVHIKGPRLPGSLTRQLQSGNESETRPGKLRVISRKQKRQMKRQEKKRQHRDSRFLKTQDVLAPMSVGRKRGRPQLETGGPERANQGGKCRVRRSQPGQPANRFFDLLREEGEGGLSEGRLHGTPSAQAAIEEEDRQIARLEKLLAATNEKGKERLSKEYSTFDGMDVEFGGFLENLDRLDRLVDTSRQRKEPTSTELAAFEKSGERDDVDCQSGADYTDGDDIFDQLPTDDEDVEELEIDYSDESPSEAEEDTALEADAAGGDGGETLELEGELRKGYEFDSQAEDGDTDESQDSPTEEESEADTESQGDRAAGSVDAKMSRVLGPEDCSRATSDAPDDGAADDVRHSSSTAPAIDLYGRPIEPPTALGCAYVPPHLRRSKTETQEGEAVDKELCRAVNGCLNRLTENNLEPSLVALQELYVKYPRADVNHLLLKKMFQAIRSEQHLAIPIVSTFAAIVAGLNLVIGVEVGGFVVEKLCRTFNGLVLSREDITVADDGDGETKFAQNLALLISHLFNLGVVGSKLVRELVEQLLKAMSEESMELLLVLLSNANLQGNTEDSKVFGDILEMVEVEAKQKGASLASKTGKELSAVSRIRVSPVRVQVMLDMISGIRSTKRKGNIIHQQSQERWKRLRKWLGRLRSKFGCQGGGSINVSFTDLLNADVNGRWWIIGGTWVGRDKVREQTGSKTGGSEASGVASASVEDKHQAELLKLCSRQGMNTDVRRAVFCVIMGSADIDDAIEKLLRLNLNDKQEREIVKVLVDCCGQERTYNAYYAHLGARLCGFHSRFKFTFQLSFWDLFKDWERFKARRLRNLAKLLAFLLLKYCLSVALLKRVDFTTLSEPAVFFFKTLMAELCLKATDEAHMKDVLGRLAHSKDVEIVRDGLSVFFHQYMANVDTLRSYVSKSDSSSLLLLKRRLKIARKLLEQMQVVTDRM